VPPHDENRINDLETELYSRDFKNEPHERPTFSTESKENAAVPTEFKQEAEAVPHQPFVKPIFQRAARTSIFNRIFLVSLVFFLISASVAVYVFFGGFNIISAHKVDMNFIGPVSIAAGDELNFDIVVNNQNSTPLLNAELYIDYPDGTKSATDLRQDLTHEKEVIGDVPARTTVRRTIRSVLFGKEQTTKDINVTLQYGVSNSNGNYKKEKTYQVGISSTPVTLTVNHPAEVASGQEITYDLEISSNSAVPLTDLLLKAEYPFGFDFRSATPQPDIDKSYWKIPTLEPGEKKTFSITGRAEGDEGDERVLKFSVGFASDVDEKKIATTFITSSESVAMRRPPVTVNMTINNATTPEVVVEPGQPFQGKIEVVNNLPGQVTDAEINLVLGGTALDATSPVAQGALYRLPTKTLTWDESSQPVLKIFNPGDRVQLIYSVTSLSPAQLLAVKNGSVSLGLTLTGTSIDSGKKVTTQISRLVKVQPAINLIPRIVYSLGPFKNRGPVPPKSENETTYTIIWTVTGSTNAIVDAEVKGVLPGYVTWLKQVSPTTEDVTWIPERNEVVWRVGDIPPGRVGSAAKEVAFQVAVKPTFSQRGGSPIVMQSISFSGLDSFTRNTLSVSPPPLTTSLTTDPRYQQQDGNVR
jgi:hypothetical protein